MFRSWASNKKRRKLRSTLRTRLFIKEKRISCILRRRLRSWRNSSLSWMRRSVTWEGISLPKSSRSLISETELVLLTRSFTSTIQSTRHSALWSKIFAWGKLWLRRPSQPIGTSSATMTHTSTISRMLSTKSCNTQTITNSWRLLLTKVSLASSRTRKQRTAMSIRASNKSTRTRRSS